MTGAQGESTAVTQAAVIPRQIRLHHPTGNRWRPLIGSLADVAGATVNHLDLPASVADIVLKPGVDDDRARTIVRLFEASLYPDSGPIELI